jgi:hypothetical protein
MALWQAYFRVLRFSPVRIIAPMLHNIIYARQESTAEFPGRILETPPQHQFHEIPSSERPAVPCGLTDWHEEINSRFRDLRDFS